LRAVDLRAVDLRAPTFLRAVDLRAPTFLRAVDFFAAALFFVAFLAPEAAFLAGLTMPPFVNPELRVAIALEGTVGVDGPFLAGAAYLATVPPLLFRSSSHRKLTENLKAAPRARARDEHRVRCRVARLVHVTVEKFGLAQDCC
jgi:hypothetical protein